MGHVRHDCVSYIEVSDIGFRVPRSFVGRGESKNSRVGLDTASFPNGGFNNVQQDRDPAWMLPPNHGDRQRGFLRRYHRFFVVVGGSEKYGCCLSQCGILDQLL